MKLKRKDGLEPRVHRQTHLFNLPFGVGSFDMGGLLPELLGRIRGGDDERLEVVDDFGMTFVDVDADRRKDFDWVVE